MYGFTDYSAKEVQNFVLNFTKNLRGAKSYDNRGVEEVLEDKKKLKVMVKIFGRKTILELNFVQVVKE